MKDTIKSPCLYFPTSVIILDDQTEFTEELSKNLSPKNKYELFNNPFDFLHYYGENLNFFDLELTNPLLFKKNFQQPNTYETIFDLKTLSHIATQPIRHKAVSTVIVDYAMPGLNGIQVAEKIKNPFVQKILLTGEADEKIAVEAFNRGIIHKYIKKSSLEFFDVLQESIFEHSLRFFNTLSKDWLQYILQDSENNQLFKNRDFQAFLLSALYKNDVSEYYMVDPSTVFLTIKPDGSLGAMFFKTEEQVADDFYELEDQCTKSEGLDLKEGTLMFCCRLNEGESYPKDIRPYLSLAEKINHNSTTFFYSNANISSLNLKLPNII